MCALDSWAKQLVRGTSEREGCLRAWYLPPVPASALFHLRRQRVVESEILVLDDVLVRSRRGARPRLESCIARLEEEPVEGACRCRAHEAWPLSGPFFVIGGVNTHRCRPAEAASGRLYFNEG